MNAYTREQVTEDLLASGTAREEIGDIYGIKVRADHVERYWDANLACRTSRQTKSHRPLNLFSFVDLHILFTAITNMSRSQSPRSSDASVVEEEGPFKPTDGKRGRGQEQFPRQVYSKKYLDKITDSVPTPKMRHRQWLARKS